MDATEYQLRKQIEELAARLDQVEDRLNKAEERLDFLTPSEEK